METKKYTELKKAVKDFIKDLHTYPLSGMEIALVYDTKEGFFDSMPIEDTVYAHRVTLYTQPSRTWLNFIYDIRNEAQALTTDEPKGTEFIYPQEVISRAQELAKNEELDASDIYDAQRILEESGASEYIQSQGVQDSIDDYMLYLDEIAEKAAEAFDECVDDEDEDED